MSRHRASKDENRLALSNMLADLINEEASRFLTTLQPSKSRSNQSSKSKSLSCSVCLDSWVDDIHGVICGEGHFTCSHCLNLHVVAQCGSDPARPDFAELHDTRRGDDVAGFRCPHFAARQCSAPVLGFKELACFPMISQDTFATACQFVHALREQEKQSRLRASEHELSAEQLLQLFPRKAYQCSKCGLGPVLHQACSDLGAHHGNMVGKTGIVSNACQGCGWFSAQLKDWAQWDGSSIASGGSSGSSGSSAALPSTRQVADAAATVSNVKPPKSATWLHRVEPFSIEIDPSSPHIDGNSKYVVAIVSAMQVGITDHKVVLTALCALDKNFQRLLRRGHRCFVDLSSNAIAAVVRCLVALGEDHPKIATSGLSVLSTVMSMGTVRTKNTVRRAGGIRAIMRILANVSALSNLASHNLVIDKGSQALLSLATSYSKIILTSDAEGFDVLRAARTHQLPNLASQASAVFDELNYTFLQRISKRNLAKMSSDTATITAVLSVLREVGEKLPKVVVRCCSILEELCRSRLNCTTSCTIIREMGGISAIVHSLVALGETEVEVAMHACGALCNIIHGIVENQIAVRTSGGITAVIRSMSAWKNDVGVAQYGCLALQALVHGDNTMNQDAISVAGGLTVIVDCLVLHVDNQQLLEWGYVALNYLARGNNANKRAILSVAGIDAIVAGLEEHGKSSWSVAMWGCEVLMTLAHNDPVIKKAIAIAKGDLAVESAMLTHRSNVKFTTTVRRLPFNRW